jgi:transposase
LNSLLLLVLFYIFVAFTCCFQDFCHGCNIRLARIRVVNHHRYCLNCCPPVVDIPYPPSSPVTPPPSSPPPPLFDRPRHSHLPLSPIERSAAVVLTRIEETQQQAAYQLGTTRQTISHWQHTFEEANNINDAARSGRPRETSEDENINIVATSVIDHYLTPRQLLKELDLNISARTVDRRLQEAGLFGRVALKKRKFDEEEKKKRLSFVKGYTLDEGRLGACYICR